MTILVGETFTRIAKDLHETDNTFSSGAWSVTEMLGYLNSAEKEFLKYTGILKIVSTITADPGDPILFNRPENTMDLDRISFDGKALRRQTSWDFEREDRNWRTTSSGKPSYWHEDHLSNGQFELNKIPVAGGILRIIADYLPSAYASILNAIHLKDIWEQYLRWKVLAYALEKDGDDQDIGRSKYANRRFKIGVELARRLVTGNPSLRMPE